jgi:hypothetical protein
VTVFDEFAIVWLELLIKHKMPIIMLEFVCKINLEIDIELKMLIEPLVMMVVYCQSPVVCPEYQIINHLTTDLIDN